LVLLIHLVLARNVRLYAPVKVTGKSFVGVKRCTVPNQSMSLREILERFVKRESLPLVHEGQYEERFGDLEKVANMDIVDQKEYAADLRKRIGEGEKAIVHRAKVKKDMDDAAKAPPPSSSPTPFPTSPPVPGS